MGRLKIWNASSSLWQYVDSPPATTSASYALTSSYALNGGGSGVSASYASSASYINEASASILTGSLYLRSNSGSLWKVTIYEDGNNVGTIYLEGPYA